MDPMDLTQAYRYRFDWMASFVAVAEYGRFSAAATALDRKVAIWWRSDQPVSPARAAVQEVTCGLPGPTSAAEPFVA